MLKRYALGCRLLLILAVVVSGVAAAAVAFRYTLLAIILAGAVWWRRLGRWRGSISHGSGRLASFDDLDGMLGDDEGLILGRVGINSPTKRQALRALFSPSVSSEMAVGMIASAFYKSRWMAERLIRVRDYVHLATIARTGGCKGVSVVIPTLLSYRGSCVVIDPKCENFKITAEFRRTRMGHDIIRLDPMHLGGPGAVSFNPLAFIDASAPDFLDQCRDLANMLVLRQGTEPDPHWNDAAELVLTAFIAFVCVCESDPNERNLETVRLLVSDRKKFELAVEIMRQVDNEAVRRLGGQLTWFVDRELGGVLTTVQQHTTWMDSPAVAPSLRFNNFDPRALRSGRVTVFLVLPPERLVTWAPLTRMWVGSILRILSRAGADEQRQIMFLLDEVAQLGRLQALEDAVCIMRGYGIRLWFILQSLEQLKIYGDKAGVILDNIGTQQYFAISSLETAEILSKRIGDSTIRVRTPSSTYGTGSSGTSDKAGQSWNSSTSSGLNTAELARKVLLHDEILRLPEDVSLIFHKNRPVIPARLLKYYNAKEFKGGGMGAQPGLGAGAGVMAAFSLAASLFLATFLIRLPSALAYRLAPRPGYVAAAPQQSMRPMPSSIGGVSSRPAPVRSGASGAASGNLPEHNSNQTKGVSDGE